MTVTQSGGGPGPSPTGLAEVIDSILDKGLVIDAYVRVSLVGIELLTIDARVVVASVDTYLRFAEAVNRLDISRDKKDVTDLVGGKQENGGKGQTKGAVGPAGAKRESAAGSQQRAHASRTSER